MERYAGKVAVVTGASGGMGSAIIKELLTFNITVVALDMNTEKLKVLEDEISKNSTSYNGKFFPKTCDVSKEEDVKKIFQWIDEDLKMISILINGAGIFVPQGQNVLDAETKTFDVTFDTNVKGALLCSREAANLMIKYSEPGHIIDICSISAYDKIYFANTTTYAASKCALHKFTDSFRREVSKKRANIKATIFSPGVTRTGIASPSLYEGKSREEVLEPEDIAKTLISVLSTPQWVSISEIIVEPLYEADLDI